MERNDEPKRQSPARKTRTVRIPKAANDNWIDVSDDLPESLSIGDWELELLDSHMWDILTDMIAANDN